MNIKKKNYLPKIIIDAKILFLFFLIFFSFISGYGADSSHYLNWAIYFKSGNIDVLSSYSKTENGLPLSTWYYGSGLISGFISKLFFVDGTASMKVNSIILTVSNIFLLFKILEKYKFTQFSNLFAISLFYLFLPAGFYLNKFSSETWTIFFTLLSIFVYEILNLRKKINFFLIGISFYFLILIKPINIFLVLSIIAIFFLKDFKTIKKKNFNKIIYYFFLSIFIIVSILLLIIYHKILLGSYFQSFYDYGDEIFKSFHIQNFKLKEVLFSSWHGLFLYHPVYLILSLILPLIFFLKKDLNVNIKYFILIISLLFITHLIIQSSHFFWWMGTNTYGARGFAGISILFFYLILNLNNDLKKKIKLNFLLKSLLVISLIWHSYLLSMEETNFVTYKVFFVKLLSQYSATIIFKIILIFLFVFCYLKYFEKFNFNKFFKISSISLIFFIVFDQAITDFQFNFLYYFMFAIFLVFLFKKFYKNIIPKKNYKLSNLGNLLLIIIFLNSFYFQFNMFHQYKKLSVNNFQTGNNTSCKGLKRTIEEYNFVPGYNYEKKILLNYFKNTGC